MLDEEFTPPKGLADYAADVVRDHDVVLPALVKALDAIASEPTPPGPEVGDLLLAEAQPDCTRIADVNSEPIPPYRVGDPDPTPALRRGQQEVCLAESPHLDPYQCTMPKGHDPARHVAGTGKVIVAIWQDSSPAADSQQAARDLLAALPAAGVSYASVTVSLPAFGAWLDVLAVETFKAEWTSVLGRVHVWVDCGIQGIRSEFTVNAFCAAIAGHDITEVHPTVAIPAAEVGRLVAPATQGGAR